MRRSLFFLGLSLDRSEIARRRPSIATALALLASLASASLTAPRGLAATFGSLSGQVQVRANTKTDAKSVTQYAMPDGSGGTGVAVTDFVGASFDSASASAGVAILSNRRINFDLVATSATDTTTTPSTPRATALSTITQPFSLSEPQRVRLEAEISAAVNATQGATSAVAYVANASNVRLLEILSVSGGQVDRSAIVAAGNFNFVATASSNRHTPGSNAASFGEGSLVFTSLADINLDFIVGATDLQAWANVFGATGPAALTGDLDGNTLADGRDFMLWQRQFGNVPAATIVAAANVPEPTCWFLVTAATLPIALKSTSRGKRRS